MKPSYCQQCGSLKVEERFFPDITATTNSTITVRSSLEFYVCTDCGAEYAPDWPNEKKPALGTLGLVVDFGEGTMQEVNDYLNERKSG